MFNHGCVAVGKSVRPANGRLGVQIPVATTQVVRTCSDSPTAKRSALRVGVTGTRRCAEHRSKFAALHRQW